MNDPTKPMRPGDLVTTPAGRLAKVLAVDTRKGEVEVETLPNRMRLRAANVRPADEGGVLVLSYGTPEEACDGDA